MWWQCHVEQWPNDRWYICYPDGSDAFLQNFKNKNWATRTLNWLIKEENK